MSKKSILDTSLENLLSYDISYLRETFLNEVKDLANLDSFWRDTGLNKIFSMLFFIEGDSSIQGDFPLTAEHKLYADLISTPGLSDIDYVRDFLKDYEDDEEYLRKSKLLLKIFDFYDNHSRDEIDKFNYIFRSSFRISLSLMYKDASLEKYFSSRILNMFDKETLCQLYRFCFYRAFTWSDLDEILSIEKHKSLYMLSIIAMKLKNETGHNSEFLYRFIHLNNKDGLYRLLDSMYDYYVGDSSKEEEFRNKFLRENSYWEIDEMVRILLNGKFYDSYTDTSGNVFDYFEKGIIHLRDNLHYCVFEYNGLVKIRNNTFDLNRDFKKIEIDNDLTELKNAFLSNIYGISLEEAKKLIDSYGLFLDEENVSIKDTDEKILSILKTINGIVSLEIDEVEKIRSLQLFYYNFVKEVGLYNKNNFYSFFVLEGLFNKMVINTYNKKLLDVSRLKLLGEKDGVSFFDAGLNFDIMLSSLGGVGKLYSDYANIKDRWNTSGDARNNGLCCSHINNENLGVISLNSVILGFTNLPDYALNRMGSTDIFSRIYSLDLRSNDAVRVKKNIFYPVNVLPNETRYGYNEILIDRFLMDDKDDILKLQPSYVVFYKFSDDYQDGIPFSQSLKTAKDFGIPIVVIDVKKIKEQEKSEINLMEEKLFSSSNCDSLLMKDIVVRYMNNYTGSFVLSHTLGKDSDFSILGMENFFDRLFIKLKTMDDEVTRREWVDSLIGVYKDEERKYYNAINVDGYDDNLNCFMIDRYGIKMRLGQLDKDEVETVELSCDDDHYLEYKTIACLVDKLNDEKVAGRLRLSTSNENSCLIEFHRHGDQEIILIEELVVSYFFESKRMCIDEMDCFDFESNISFAVTDDFDFVKEISNSSVYSSMFKEMYNSNVPKFNNDKLNMILNKVEEIPNEEFLKLFSPVISSYASVTNQRFEQIACNLLDKKKNIRSEFERLRNIDKDFSQVRK